MAMPSGYHGQSFSRILEMNNGTGRGFDVLRLGLAALILLSHTSGIIGTSGTLTAMLNWLLHIGAPAAHGVAPAVAAGFQADGLHEAPLTGVGRPITLAYLPMFFALSGFLVTGSALRTGRLLPFLSLRVLRLLPALLVEVTLSAVILGGLFTTLPLDTYYGSQGFFTYFLNIIGDVHFFLPGVFENTSDVKAVNTNLWTLPWEFDCYIVMSGLILSSLLLRRGVLLILYVILTIGLLIASLGFGFQVVPSKVDGPTLIYYFISGTLLYVWRDKIRYDVYLVVGLAVVCYALMMSARTVFIYPLALTYITIFIGLSPVPRFRLLKTGDYSYGIYLYGMPVTQAIVARFPELKESLPLTALAALATTTAFAMLSWHLIEKPCLKLKRFINVRSSEITATLHPEAFANSSRGAAGRGGEPTAPKAARSSP